MRHRKLVRIGAIAVSAVLVLGAAQAAMKLKLTHVESATVVEVTDGGAGDLNALAGVITFSGPVGVFGINVSTSISKPNIGNPFDAALDLNSVNIATTGAGTLLLETTDTGYTLPGGAGNYVHTAAAGGTISTNGSTIQFQTIADMQDGEYGLPTGGESVLTSGLLTGPAYAIVGNNVFPGNGGAPFSLTNRVNIVATGAGTLSSFDFETHVLVPEPSSLAMLVPGLAPLGLAIKRRRSKKA
jgi:hypothetical protein